MKMDKEAFWRLIDEVNRSVDIGIHGEVLDETIDRLVDLPAAEIVGWYNIQGVYTNIAERDNLWAAYKAIRPQGTNDGFLNFRLWLISQGRDVYMATIHDPDFLARLDIPRRDVEFEDYGYAPAFAYAIRAIIMQKGLDALLFQFHRWCFRHSDILPVPGAFVSDQDTRFIWHKFCLDIAGLYDIHKAVGVPPMNARELHDIYMEFSASDMPAGMRRADEIQRFVPKLYKKYALQRFHGVTVR